MKHVRVAGLAALFAISPLVLAAGESLPYPPAAFDGKLDPSRDQSRAAWPKPVHAPKGAPNIVVIHLDPSVAWLKRRPWNNWPGKG